MAQPPRADGPPIVPAGMQAALDAARRGAGSVSPNPLVGACLLVPGADPVVAYHHRFGGPHAEALLLDRVAPRGRLPRGSVLYVTLEPCSHRGKRPPCVERILEARPDQVIVAAADPYPAVNGRGIRELRRAGIDVRVGVGARPAVEMNLAFHLRHRLQRSAVTLKLAASLDARLGRTGDGSRWISGPQARRRVHRERAQADAVLVGAQTVLSDRPRLNVREVRGSQPSRIVVDSALRIPARGSIWRAWRDERAAVGRLRRAALDPVARFEGNHLRREDGDSIRWERRSRIVVATARGADAGRCARFRDAGWEVWELPTRRGHVSLRALLRRSAREGFLRLLAEAGPRLAGALLDADLVDELSLYLAPVILGGEANWPAGWTAGRGAEFEPVAQRRVGRDLWIGLRRRGRIEELLGRATPD